MSYASLQGEGIYSLIFLNSTSFFYFTISQGHESYRKEPSLRSLIKEGLVALTRPSSPQRFGSMEIRISPGDQLFVA